MYLMISSLLPNTLSLKNIRRPTFAIRGGSNGGLLVATMTQRPELMKVALPAVMDMLRYHTFTAGAGWVRLRNHRTAKRCLSTSKATHQYKT
jgi:hypothetical protein